MKEKENPFSLTEMAGEKRLHAIRMQREKEADEKRRKEILMIVAFGVFMAAVVIWLMARGIGGQWLQYAVGGMWMAFSMARANYNSREGRRITRLEWGLSLCIILALLCGMAFVQGRFEDLQRIFNLT